MQTANRNRHKATALIVTILVLLAFAGCAPETRYKVLTVFFTGVPTPAEAEDQKRERAEHKLTAEREKQRRETEAAAVQQTNADDLATKESPPKPQLYSHLPYANGSCDGCHVAAISLRAIGVQKSTKKFSKGGGRPGPLVAPRQKLCLICHPDHSSREAMLQGLRLHTPSQNGDCNQCHDPHQSKFPMLLINAPEVLCLPCHSPEDVAQIPGHAEGLHCLDCHNPHFGKTSALLKKDYTEQPQKAKTP